MLRRNCTEALSIQANVMISSSSAKLIRNGIAPFPFPLPALLKQYRYIKRGERVRVRGHAPRYATVRWVLSPHPSPLPWGEGEPFSLRRTIQNRRLYTARCALFPLPEGEGQG